MILELLQELVEQELVVDLVSNAMGQLLKDFPVFLVFQSLGWVLIPCELKEFLNFGS